MVLQEWISGYQKAHSDGFNPTFPLAPAVGFMLDEEPEAVHGSR